MRITSKGQVTIPISVREQFGLLPDTDVDFVIAGNTVTIVSADPGPRSRGGALARRIRGRGKLGMTTDEILALTRR
jgi:AbrB family looped-hinge helix DNA binding protein